ncbi:hypothetical protein OC842_004284 [Tilletia horrida]|uniref:NADAR domain-containing protein n=1 Tax=Tilletia horrida TaxID=155126 RepID=A0AAN6GA74_9BASI|nr:hypothetical protein OC842_004284 [Tilletia horrida]
MTERNRCKTPESMASTEDEGDVILTPEASTPTPGPAQRPVIRFYHANEPFYFLTNFAPSRIFHDGVEFATAEALFQASKFTSRPYLYKSIGKEEAPRVAFSSAQRNKEAVSKDWESRSIQVMRHVQLLKYTQNNHLRVRLLQTEDAELIEASPHDAFWGEGSDGRGQSHLGKILMEVRTLISPAIDLVAADAGFFLHGIAYDATREQIELLIQGQHEPNSQPGRPSVDLMGADAYPSGSKAAQCSHVRTFHFGSSALTVWRCQIEFPSYRISPVSFFLAANEGFPRSGAKYTVQRSA